MQLPVQNSWGIGELWTLSPVVPNGQRYRKLSRSVGSVGRRSLGCNAQYRFTSADQAKRPGFLCKLSPHQRWRELACAQLSGRSVSEARDLWIYEAGFLDLLREPSSRDMPSLMRGDDYFLPQLRRALSQVAGVRPEAKSIYLGLTGTMLDGDPVSRFDDFGAAVLDITHQALFEFWHDDAEGGRKDFSARDAFARLALAARATASFPGAFEPTLCPVSESIDPMRPALGKSASFDRDRLVIDGGVLVNKPIRPAMAAIQAFPAKHQARRVLAYVVPDPGNPQKRRDIELVDTARWPLGSVVSAAAISIPRQQSIASDLAELRAHNERVRRRRRASLEMFQRDAGLNDEQLGFMATNMRSLYRDRRTDESARLIAETVVAATRAIAPPGHVVNPRAEREARDSIIDALKASSSLPWTEAELTQDWTWRGGTRGAELLADLIKGILQAALAALPPTDGNRSAIIEQNNRLLNKLDLIRRSREQERQYWSDQTIRLFHFLNSSNEPTPTSPGDPVDEVSTAGEN